MARVRHLANDIDEYIASQLAEMDHGSHRNRIASLLLFMVVAILNTTVAIVALVIMASVIYDQKFDAVGIVALTAASAAILNLLFLGVNAATVFQYRYKQYQDAYRAIQAAYVSFVYGLEKYKDGDFELLKADILRIVEYAHYHRADKLRKMLKAIKELYRERAHD